MRTSPLWPTRRAKPPYGSVEIDWSHPLAPDWGCWIFNSLVIVDLSRWGAYNYVSGYGGTALYPTSHAMGVSFGEVSGPSIVNTRAYKIGPSSIGTTRPAGSGPGVARDALSVFAVAYPIGATPNANECIINYGMVTDSNAALALCMTTGGNLAIRYDGNLTSYKVSLAVARDGSRQIIGVSKAYNAAPRFLLNSALETAPSAITGTTTVNGGLAIGAAYVNRSIALPYAGSLECVYSYSYALSDSALLALAADPYCFLRPRHERSYGFLTTATTTFWLPSITRHHTIPSLGA